MRYTLNENGQRLYDGRVDNASDAEARRRAASPPRHVVIPQVPPQRTTQQRTTTQRTTTQRQATQRQATQRVSTQRSPAQGTNRQTTNTPRRVNNRPNARNNARGSGVSGGCLTFIILMALIGAFIFNMVNESAQERAIKNYMEQMETTQEEVNG